MSPEEEADECDEGWDTVAGSAAIHEGLMRWITAGDVCVCVFSFKNLISHFVASFPFVESTFEQTS